MVFTVIKAEKEATMPVTEYLCPWDCNAIVEYPEDHCPGCSQPIEWVADNKLPDKPGGLKPIRPGTLG